MLLKDKQRLKASFGASALVTHAHGYQNTEANSCRHCGKTRHKKDSCWKKYLELISDQYKFQKREAPLTPPKLALSVGKNRLC